MAAGSSPARHPPQVGIGKGSDDCVRSRAIAPGTKRFRNLVPPRGEGGVRREPGAAAPRRAPAARSATSTTAVCTRPAASGSAKCLADPRCTACYCGAAPSNVCLRPAARRRRQEPQLPRHLASTSRSQPVVSCLRLYMPYDGFAALTKPEPWRAFFVMRDPRDVVVSWYFSSVSSIPPTAARACSERATSLNLDEDRGRSTASPTRTVRSVRSTWVVGRYRRARRLVVR